jgi:1-phosphatidylinositol phosphodiesterase
MGALDADRTIAELTIPGTHDSGGLRGMLRAKTQTMGISSQLQAGIRFFDIRLNDEAGRFRLYHGGVDERTDFGPGVVTPIVAFLAAHPGELVVMSVKQEDEGDAGTFARDFDAFVADQAPSFYVAPGFPRLADARGKIVVFRRFADSSLGIPADPAHWQNNATFEIPTPAGRLAIEDHWDLGATLPWQMDDKWAAVARNLDGAATGPSTDWYITFTSATSDFSIPRVIAGGIPLVDGINQRLLDYVGAHPHHRLGTILMDFPELPDARLIQSLIDANS